MDPSTTFALAGLGRNKQSSAEETTRREARWTTDTSTNTRGISRWHQKSEYETRRKLHDVIIVLWECLEWSEYHNTGVAYSLWELLLQILQSTTVVVLARSSTPTWLSLVSPRNRTSSHVSHSVRTASHSFPPQATRFRSFAPSLSVHFLRRSYERRATFQASDRVYDKLGP